MKVFIVFIPLSFCFLSLDRISSALIFLLFCIILKFINSFKSVLLTNLDRSRLLHIGHVCPRVFMERDKVDIYKNAKRTRLISAADPGKGPGRPPLSPPPLCLEQNEARTAGKFVFGDCPPLSQSLDGCPPPHPKVWICYYISSHLDRTSLFNKRFITWPKRKGFRRASGRERQVHLSSSGSQSEHRICLTLPAGRVSHIQFIIHLIISSLLSVRQATC